MTRAGAAIWAILPIKSLDDAKQRLSNILSPQDRRCLMLNSLRDVLTALTQSSRLAGTLVVSKDIAALGLASEHGARQLIVDSDLGQSEAVFQGASYLHEQGIRATVTVPGDAPFVTSEDVDIICDQLSSPATVVMVSNSDNTGTNSIGVFGEAVFRYQFGCNSFARHTSTALSQGIEPEILRLPRLELDIDTEADLSALMVEPSRTETQRFLTASGIAQRLSYTDLPLRKKLRSGLEQVAAN